jgi:hypothetical protein
MLREAFIIYLVGLNKLMNNKLLDKF